MMTRKYHFVLITLIAMILFASCDKGLVYSHSAVIDQGEWNYEEPLVYDIIAEDTTKYYELFLNVMHASDFGYENFYTKISTVFPDGEELFDVVSIQLADKMGSWNGNCSSTTCESSLLLQDGFRFKQAGPHQIILENYSREKLVGIESIELKLYSIEDY